MANIPGGKNQAKKVYSYIRVPKHEIFVVINNVTKSYDLQATSYHRDFFQVVNDALASTTQFPTGSIPGEYDEDLVSFNWETSNLKSFNIAFTSNPIVVLDIIPNEQLENVNVFLIANTTTTLTVGTSAPFSGSVRYRAIHSPTYPVTIHRNTLSSSFLYLATAGFADVTGLNYFTASYIPLGIPPSSIFFTPYDFYSNDMVNVAFVNSSSFGLTQTSGDISSAIIGRVNFLAIV